jgi:NAD+ synthase (glutamine-hydrolysing)
MIEIKSIMESIEKSLENLFYGLPKGLTEENIQSRIRGLLLMAISNKFGNILVNTSNKSEMAVGYSTLYGDSNGAFSVLGDLYKTEVYELAQYLNQKFDGLIPELIITRPPSAELRPDQKDSDSLPEYDILDKLLYNYIELKKGPLELESMGFEKSIIDRILSLVNKSEFKRFQAPPILRVSNKAFGVGRRLPIVAKYL